MTKSGTKPLALAMLTLPASSHCEAEWYVCSAFGLKLFLCFQKTVAVMVRHRKRKTNMGLFSENDMRAAVDLVSKGMSLRQAAAAKNVNYGTLFRYVKKAKTNEGSEIRMCPKYNSRRIFTNEQEVALVSYLVQCAKMCYGLDTVETRRLAFEMAQHNSLEIPPSWLEKKMADVFNDDDYLSSAVTDRPEDQNEMLAIDNSLSCTSGEGNIIISETVVLNGETENKQISQIPTQVISPEMFRGYPKAESRKPCNKRRKGRSCIPTDTPVKESLVQRAQQRNAKKKTKVEKKASKKLYKEELDTTDDEDNSPVLTSSEDINCLEEDDEPIAETREPKVGDYVLVKFSGKKLVFYVGKIIKQKDEDGDFEISYLRKSVKDPRKFMFPVEPDIASVAETDITMVLPQPLIAEPALRERQCSLYLAVPPSSPPRSYVRMRTPVKYHVAGTVKRTVTYKDFYGHKFPEKGAKTHSGSDLTRSVFTTDMLERLMKYSSLQTTQHCHAANPTAQAVV
uniref:HTH psq-type domain-containing protein n=1 Tax=Timema monikensis TaxID=170555 RepID=A0A7R9EKB6_9NEOP|nr:unnamed protein product [Timema monikensis]